MKEYLKIGIFVSSEEESAILIAQLSDIGFYAFEEEEKKLFAYIEKDNFNKAELDKLLPVNSRFNIEVIQEENWNKNWEQNFQPVILGNFVAIRAKFHAPVREVKHEIIITPKMSFGTGHHPTTLMMIKLMGRINFRSKTVIDFGTGTGVLAILAMKLGASSVVAIDNDPWSIENAKENFEENNCTGITVTKDETIRVGGQSDIIVANINLNVLISNLQTLSRKTKPDGYLLLSGFLWKDEDIIKPAFTREGFVYVDKEQVDDWCAMAFQKK